MSLFVVVTASGAEVKERFGQYVMLSRTHPFQDAVKDNEDKLILATVNSKTKGAIQLVSPVAIPDIHQGVWR